VSEFFVSNISFILRSCGIYCKETITRGIRRIKWICPYYTYFWFCCFKCWHAF